MIYPDHLASFYATALNTMLGVESIDESYSRAAACLGASKWQIFRHIVTPGSAPLHLYGPADLGGRGLVLPRGGGDGVGRIRARLRDQHLVQHGALSDDRDRHDHARRRGLREQRSGAHGRRLHDEWRVRELALGGQK